jgi:leucyl aminopeptidase
LLRAGSTSPRLVVVGVGKARELKARDFVKLGGAVMGKIPGRRRGGDHHRRSARRVA